MKQWQRGSRLMVDKGAEERGEIYVAWYEGEQMEEWNEMKTGKKAQVNTRETFLADLLDRWANLPNETSSSPQERVRECHGHTSLSPWDPQWYHGFPSFSLRMSLKVRINPYFYGILRGSQGHVAHVYNSRHSYLLTITKIYYLFYNF